MKPTAFELANTSLNLISQSLVKFEAEEFGLTEVNGTHKLVALLPLDSKQLSGFEGQTSDLGENSLFIGDLSAKNAAALRSKLPWLQPRTLGLSTSIGTGDRLGLATPGHVRAVRYSKGKILPIFAQQSIREMSRTGRSPQQVMDDATWGIFQEGWQLGVGADADHLKTTENIDVCLAAGFTFFVIDPGEYVDDYAESASQSELDQLIGKLPPHLQPPATGLLDKTFDLEGLTVNIDKHTLAKAAAKYGHAVNHIAMMYNHLVKNAGDRPYELEISVDETEQPTSHAEHIYIASELKRLGVKWVSLAPRYVGRFEKGVDYIGDLDIFEKDLIGHAAIARQMGPYKLSIHSGSDKFSIYPIIMRHTNGLVHLKTAGTSYLEALRSIAEIDIEFFKQIYTFSRDNYEKDRATYHVSADLSRAPLPENITDWPGLLDQFDAREIMHVTFGSVLTQKTPSGNWQFYQKFMELLQNNPERYAQNLEKHFIKHLKPFMDER